VEAGGVAHSHFSFKYQWLLMLVSYEYSMSEEQTWRVL